MKIYIASKFPLVDRVRKVASILKAKGHTITCKWWLRDYKKIMENEDIETWFHHFKIREVSERSFKGIREADIFILIAPSDKATKFNGANIELGYALALKKPCYSIGKLERSAMYFSVKRCEFIEEILEEKVRNCT